MDQRNVCLLKIINKDANGSLNKRSKDQAPESGENTTATSQQASRPRTSRGNRPSSKVGRRGDGTGVGGHSAMGFHSNTKQHHLLYNNIENSKVVHHRSVNEALDSPRSKKRKNNKGRISPNTFIVHHQRQPSAALKHK